MNLTHNTVHQILTCKLRMRKILFQKTVRRTSKNISMTPQPRYLHYLKPCSLFLFGRFENHSKDIILGNLSNWSCSLYCYEFWKNYLLCLVASQKRYFEGKKLKKSVSLLNLHTLCLVGMCFYIFICRN